MWSYFLVNSSILFKGILEDRRNIFLEKNMRKCMETLECLEVEWFAQGCVS